MAGHALQALGGVDDLLDHRVALVHLPQGFGGGQGPLQGDVQGVGHLLGDGVHLGIGHVQGPAHVPDGPLGGHGAKGDDLGHVVGAVFAVDVVDNLSPAAVAEVHVDIGHGHPLGVEEAFKVEGVLHGVHVGDVQAVGHHGPGGGAAARPHGDLVGLGVADEVGDDEEILHKAHPANHGHLVLQLFLVVGAALGIAPGKALAAELLKVGVGVGAALGELKFRQVVDPKLEVHVAGIRDLGGVLNGLGPVGEEGCHLLLRLEVKLRGLKAHPAGVLHGLAHLDAHEHILEHRVLAGEVVGIVGGHQGDARLLVKFHQSLDHLFLLGDAVVLEFQVVVPLPEEVPHGLRVGLGPGVVPGQQQPGQLAGQAGRQGDEALVVALQQLPVHPGLAVKALGKAPADHSREVPVPLLVAAQQDQMIGVVVQLVDPVEPGAGGHIDLTADDGLDAGGLGRPVEVDGPIHHPMVGDRHSRLTQLLGPVHQPGDAAGPIQQTVLRVHMQMHKRHKTPPLSTPSSSARPKRRRRLPAPAGAGTKSDPFFHRLRRRKNTAQLTSVRPLRGRARRELPFSNS